MELKLDKDGHTRVKNGRYNIDLNIGYVLPILPRTDVGISRDNQEANKSFTMFSGTFQELTSLQPILSNGFSYLNLSVPLPEMMTQLGYSLDALMQKM